MDNQENKSKSEPNQEFKNIVRNILTTGMDNHIKKLIKQKSSELGENEPDDCSEDIK